MNWTVLGKEPEAKVWLQLVAFTLLINSVWPLKLFVVSHVNESFTFAVTALPVEAPRVTPVEKYMKGVELVTLTVIVAA